MSVIVMHLLQDILENDDIQLDLLFKNSLMSDLAEVGVYKVLVCFLYFNGFMVFRQIRDRIGHTVSFLLTHLLG